MSEKAWKRSERRIAELLGGRRVPVSGRQRGATPDVEHDALSIEVKTRKSLPVWLEDALRLAEGILGSRADAGRGPTPARPTLPGRARGYAVERLRRPLGAVIRK